MKKNRIKIRRIYPIIWSGIIVISIYLIVRFSTLSFSDNIGQADMSLRDVMFSGLCSKVMEDGAALISYNANDENQIHYPIVLTMNDFALQRFTDTSSIQTVQAEEYSSLLSENSLAADSSDAVETINSNELKNDIDIYDISDQYLSEEYVLSNGAYYNSDLAGEALTIGGTQQLQIGYEDGDVDAQETKEDTPSGDSESVVTVNTDGIVDYTIDQLKDVNFLVQKFYIVHSSTKVTNKLFNVQKLMGMDMTLKQENEDPQILIYHTHAHEAYIDSKSGVKDDTVVGVGTRLTKILEEDYGYNVIHDTTTYDEGKDGRNIAYNRAKDSISKILDENPSIEVIIDLHRDSGAARTVVIDGKETAKVMLFNGLSRDQNGPIAYLANPNLQDNLAFSFQLQNKSHELYPGFFLKNYLKALRFNLHLRPKSLLVELGTEYNTVKEAKNAMEPFAEVLDAVLKGDNEEDKEAINEDDKETDKVDEKSAVNDDEKATVKADDKAAVNKDEKESDNTDEQETENVEENE